MEIRWLEFHEMDVATLYRVIQLREQVFVVEQDCPYLDCDGYDPKSRHLILQEDDQIIGTLRIIPAGVKYDEVSIGRVVVDPRYRRRGLAEAMMQAALVDIKSRYGQCPVELSAQVAIHKLYERVGFQKVGAIYLEDDIDHIKMVLDWNRNEQNE